MFCVHDKKITIILLKIRFFDLFTILKCLYIRSTCTSSVIISEPVLGCITVPVLGPVTVPLFVCVPVTDLSPVVVTVQFHTNYNPIFLILFPLIFMYLLYCFCPVPVNDTFLCLFLIQFRISVGLPNCCYY